MYHFQIKNANYSTKSKFLKSIKMLERKTLKQIKIELNITNRRSYQTVPYTKLLGQKNALKQWLLFSNERCVGLGNYDSDKTPFLGYVTNVLHDKIIGLTKGLEVESYIPYIIEKSNIKSS